MLEEVNYNQLRETHFLFRLDDFLPRLIEILNDLDTESFVLKPRILCKTNVHILDKVSLDSIEKDIVLLNSLFALNCSRTLVIVTSPKRLKEASNLMGSLSTLLLFRWDNDYMVFDELKAPESW